MILIKENITKKLPGETSLFVTFEYHSQIVEALKALPSYTYDKNTKTWEVPLTSLAVLLDKLCVVDDITIELLPDKQDKKDRVFELQEYKTTPFNYQLDGIQFGLNHDNFLLLDAPGLGKTLTLICLAQELKERENLEHCLVICGINTLKTNWKKEIEQHSNLSCKILGERVSKNGKHTIGSVAQRLEDLKNPIDEFFVVTNIETLRSDDILKELTKGKANKFDMVIIDEIHTCKSPTSQQGKHLLKLTTAKHKIGATGTLLLNNPLDAYVPLKWIGADRATYTNFKYYYCNYGGPFNNILVGFRNMDVLKDELEKYSLRRTKDLLNLPPKTIINEYVDMNDTQQLFYDNIKDGIIEQVDKVHMSTANLLAMVSRLRQATVCPSILTTENISSSKLVRAQDLAEQIIQNGDKVVIFSTFKDSLNPLKEALSQYNPVLCTGDVKDLEISENIDRFQSDSSCKVFLATWAKCGTGITLTAANYAIFLDTPWTSAVFQQAQDRIYRIGTTDSVFIYNLICKNTIDERVLEIVDDKEAIADYVVDDKVTEKSIESLRKYILELSEDYS
jgi:SNF2 family DNA or RNA helicase